ncbi:MAG: hypothetical protein M3Q30_04085 [Actinomycetota bacterium]|nr:hypothetical protein [Actinomycetota bacterium]
MARIIIHAGMAKTGSSSVQRWIALNADRIREQSGIHTVVATNQTQGNPTKRVHVEPFRSGRLNSGLLVYSWIAQGRSPAFVRRMIDELSGFADTHPSVLITAEALAVPFWELDAPFLLALDDLARRHEVRVAYYVRPQHTAIEAMWRQDGCREGKDPSTYAAEQSNRGLHYLRTLDGVQRGAPHVRFEIRPFRADLLAGGGPVEDFVRTFLSLNERCPEICENVGLPLELVNVLRRAPEGIFWDRAAEKYPRRELKAAFEGLTIPESPKIQRSRLILRQYCYEVFEPENRELIRRLGWSTSNFVHPAERLDRAWSLSELDTLWAPDASDAELALVFNVLRNHLDRT